MAPDAVSVHVPALSLPELLWVASLVKETDPMVSEFWSPELVNAVPLAAVRALATSAATATYTAAR